MAINYNLNETCERPWGTWKCVAVGEKYIVKVITVNPHSSLSLQMHNHRSEHWIVTKGTPTITIGDVKKEYKFGQSVDIPVKIKHRLENFTDTVSEIVEIQMGDILDEADIVRLEDVYNRVTQKTK